MDHELEDHDRGLSFDLVTLMERRRALKLFAGAGLVALVGCGNGAESTSAASGATTTSNPSGTTDTTAPTETTTGSGTDASCSTIPEETAGPYPGDGSNGPNALTESGIVRSDIRSSFGSASGVAEGVPLTIELTVVDKANGCAAMSGAAVYLSHCDRAGLYSMYSQGATDQNYLRGVQETDAAGLVTFTSIFPAAYSGRWPHVHFEVYPTLAEATSAGTQIATSQLAFPEDVCNLVYAIDGYDESVRNMAQTSLESDNVFRDGVEQQLATMTGDVTDGFVARLTVPV
jgi:protocatechuate 3,4-dioxygenase beta subunit